MGNRNINVNRGTDTKDNTIYRDYSEIIDTWSMAKAIAIVLGTLTAIWLLIYLLTRIHCALENAFECTVSLYVLWGYPLLLVTTLIIVLISIIPLIKQMVVNSAYLRMRGTRVHRDDLRANRNELFDVLRVSAKSEATAGMDTYSPSISGTKNSEPVNDDTDFDVSTIAWDEIFNRGK